ncbi:MAG: helix-turn-helix domain-containing protein [Candidatus Dojkabacteria bacterium]|nr:helix-turn-helix domain-containing protein [Candidatus Dojkabacteria bacterium]MDQ7020383.1 helix-turn-helix domain-containing protein [Candidatus Dojkabacteria bacterium]
MNKQTFKTLEKIGLSENEIKVYLEALKLDETSPYELSKLTAIPRTTVYDVITDLSLKGLLELGRSDGFTKQQIKIKAKNPSTLRKTVRQKHNDLYKLEVDLVNILPDLKESFHKDKPSNSNFEYYEGIEGAKKVYLMENEVRGEVPINVITHLMPMDAFGKGFINKDIEEVTKKVLESGQVIKELIPLNDWTKHILTYQYQRDPDYIKAREYRFIDSPIFEQYQRLAITESTAMIASTNEDEAYGIVIQSSSLAKSFKSIFLTLWVSAEAVTPSVIKSWGENQFAKFE